MWLVLTDAGDPSADWIAEGLRRRGMSPVRSITGLDLVTGVIEHYLGEHGVTTKITLRDGVSLDASSIRGVVNRLVLAPAVYAAAGPPLERDYVTQEIVALFISWLQGLGSRVINPPSPRGLCGAWRHPSEWARLAALAGLPVAPYRERSQDELPPWSPMWSPSDFVGTAVVVGQRVFGPAPVLPLSIVDAGVRLAAASECPMLGIDFVRASRGLSFANATPMPDLRLGGDLLVDALTEMLEAGAR
jgi:hypothetical protein